MGAEQCPHPLAEFFVIPASDFQMLFALTFWDVPDQCQKDLFCLCAHGVSPSV